MKKMVVVSLLLSVAALVYAFAGDTEKAPWFDMKNCEMCVAISSSPNLMENMTWEHFNISNGMMSVSTVNGEFVKAFRIAEEKIGKSVEMLKGGEKLTMCNACTAYGGLMAKGATHEEFATSHGTVSLITSDNPELVAEIHAWSDKTNAELKKFHEAQEHHGDHAEHGE